MCKKARYNVTDAITTRVWTAETQKSLRRAEECRENTMPGSKLHFQCYIGKGVSDGKGELLLESTIKCMV